MPEPRAPHAFISYVRDDSEVVDELERVLTTAGIPIWRDVRSLFPGDVWKTRIREAIQEDSLAFIAVFSGTSEARTKSQMREEIRLAIDEYRKMAPDRTWIFPVRLDDVDVPKYPISADQTLTDLNWTDFFGPNKTVNTTSLVSRVQQLLGESMPAIADRATVTASASQAARGPLLTAAIRDAARDPANAGDATQLIVEEARRVTAALNDEARFPLQHSGGSLTQESFVRVNEFCRMLEPLLEASVELGALGSSHDADLGTQIVTNFAREGFASRSGLERFITLRKLPAVLLLVAGALGATARKNGSMLNGFVGVPEVQVNGQAFPVTALLSPWDPFGPEWQLPQFIIAALEGNEVTNEVLASFDQNDVRQTRAAPASEVVQHVLQPLGLRFVIGDPEFKELFYRTEILIAAITYDRTAGQETWGWTLENWIGGHTKNEWFVTVTLPERVLAELESAGPAWWPLAGGLFGGSVERARAALQTYVTKATEARTRRAL